MRHSKVLEDLEVVLWAVSVPLILLSSRSLLHRPHKGDELSRDHPVEVPILHLFIVFILSWVEVFEAVPAQANCSLKAFKAVIDLKRVVEEVHPLTVHS